MNPNESHSSLRNMLVRFKRATKAVNRLEMVKYSLALVLWERKVREKANTRIYIINVDIMKLCNICITSLHLL